MNKITGKEIIFGINAGLSDAGAIILSFLCLVVFTTMDYLEAGTISLTIGSMIGLLVNLGVSE